MERGIKTIERTIVISLILLSSAIVLFGANTVAADQGPSLPGIPTDLTAAPGNGRVDLSWSSPDNDGGAAIDYFVIYQDDNDVKHVIGNSGTITGLTNGQKYYFTVAAHNYVGTSDGSIAVYAWPYTVPNAPTELAAAPGNGQITLNWTKPVFNGGRAIDYYIVYQDGAALPKNLSGPSTIIVGLTNGHSYTFTVSAHNLAGNGSKSNTVTATPSTAPTVPSAPTGLTAIPGNGQVSLSWTAPTTNGGAPIDYVLVYVDEVARPDHYLTNYATITGLTNGQSYVFTVADHNSVGIGPQSTAVTATPISPISVPGAPTGLTAVAGYEQVSLSWTAPVDNGGVAIDYYIIYRETIHSLKMGGENTWPKDSVNETIWRVGVELPDHQNALTAAITALGHLYSSLDWIHTYNFTVAAHNVAGTGPRCDNVSANPFSATPFDSLDIIPGNGQINIRWGLSWSDHWDDGGALVLDFVIFQDGVDIMHVDTSVYNAIITGLINGHAYSFSVAKHGAWGYTELFPQMAVPMATVPGAPTGLTAIPGNAQVSLSWSAPSLVEGSSITNYKVYRGTSSGTETLVATIGNLLSYTDTSVTVNVQYFYKVTALNANGESLFSNEANGTIPSPSGNRIDCNVKLASNALFHITSSTPVSTGHLSKSSTSALSGLIFLGNPNSNKVVLSIIPSSGLATTVNYVTLNSMDSVSIQFSIIPQGSVIGGSIKITGDNGYSNLINVKMDSSVSSYFTDFQLNRDAYSFPNSGEGNIIKNGKIVGSMGAYCYGMSMVSVLHYEWSKDRTKGIPLSGGSTYDQTFIGTEFARIFAYQHSQDLYAFFTSYSTNNYDDVLAQITQGHPVVLMLNGSLLHSVVAYGVVEYGGKAYIAIYDSNHPLDPTDPKYSTPFCWAIYDKTRESFDYSISTDISYKFNGFHAIAPLTLNIVERGGYTIIGILKAGWNIMEANEASTALSEQNVAIAHCPIDIVAKDSLGDSIGIDGGLEINQIHDATFIQVGETKFFFLPKGEDYNFSISGTGSGEYSLYFISVNKYVKDLKILAIENISVAKGSNGSIRLSNDFSTLVVNNSIETKMNPHFIYSRQNQSWDFVQSNNLESGQTKLYLVTNWNDLSSQSTSPVELKTDSNGDGVYDSTQPLFTIAPDSNSSNQSDMTIPIIGIGVVAAIGIVSIVLIRGRKKKS